MTDIVERLRSAGDRNEGRPYSTMHEAADEIERLRANEITSYENNGYLANELGKAQDNNARLTAALQAIVDYDDDSECCRMARRALEQKP